MFLIGYSKRSIKRGPCSTKINELKEERRIQLSRTLEEGYFPIGRPNVVRKHKNDVEGVVQRDESENERTPYKNCIVSKTILHLI